MEPPASSDESKIPSDSGTPSSRKRWSFRRGIPGDSSTGTSTSNPPASFQTAPDTSNSIDFNSGISPTPSRKSLISILSPFSKLLPSTSVSSSSRPVSATSVSDGGGSVAGGLEDLFTGVDREAGQSSDVVDGTSPSKGNRFSSMFISSGGSGSASGTPLSQQQHARTGYFGGTANTLPSTDAGSKTALNRVMSTTSPLFSWLRSGARPGETDIVNPMLHIATFAMNADEEGRNLHESNAQNLIDDGGSHQHRPGASSIHNVMPSGTHQPSLNFWNNAPESADESSDEQDDSPKKGKIDFSQSNENVTSLDMDSETPLIFVDTIELSVEEKLQMVFDLPEKEKYYKEFACWLVRSVLLKGYLYVTEKHLCFYSALPTVPGVVRKEGFLQRRSLKRPRSVYYTYWFVLKTDGLYIYADNKQLYFPRSTIYLKNVVSIEPKPSKQSIKLKTTSKVYILRADTLTQMNEWVEAISTAVLNAKNAGDDVRVVLPFDAVADLRVVETAFNSHSIRIMAVCEEAFQPEEYYFSYFNDIDQAYTQLKTLWDQSRKGKLAYSPAGSRLLHTRRGDDGSTIDVTSANATKESQDRPPRLDWTPPISSHSEAGSQGFVKSHRKSNSFSTSPQQSSSLELLDKQAGGGDESVDDKRRNSIGDKPPMARTSEKRSSWWTHRKTSSDGGESSFFLDEDAPNSISESKSEIFKSAFAMPQNEKLLQTFSASFMKILPLLGKLYVSTNFICFKSIRVGFRVKAVIALADIVKLDFRKGYSPFYFALVITTKNQDEIVFDFHSSDTRQKCNALLVSLLEAAGTPRRRHSGARLPRPRSAILQEIDHQDNHVKSSFTQDEISLIRPLGSELPKPAQPMHITCLTIGTRGDVQPYIALCKGLMQDGHKCRIATHEEYREWIEGFGIEFKPVKGNPAELMQLCVDYGMFTMGFIREGLKKFRGWVGELLESCWTSCQGTDLIIESPTAFGGIHVAEALQVPFFSAFPFPWTRTRTYPHPFGVAERHMGGSYNYMTYVMIEQILWKALVISVNPWRKSLGLEALSISVEDPKTPFLYSFSPSVVPPPPDWPDWIHECGYWFLDNPELNWTPPDSLTSWLKAGSTPPIYIGFGSIIVQNPDEMTRIIVEAVVKSGVRAILSKGWSSRSQQGPQTDFQYPDCIYPLKSVPHDWLFPQLAGVVHHGGAGTTAAGLRAGCPTIIHPFFGDQFFWAERVTDLGVGVCVRKLTADALAQALIQVTTDTKIQERSRLIGERIRSENGVQNAIHYIYRDLDYAKTRIQQLAEVRKRPVLL